MKSGVLEDVVSDVHEGAAGKKGGRAVTEKDSGIIPEDIEEKVDKQVKALIGEGDYLDYCHKYWRVKKQILLDEYGIDWKTPAERYPGVIFD